MNDASLCPWCGEIIVIAICEGCGYITPLQTRPSFGAQSTRALMEAIEAQCAAEGDSGWIAAVNVTARAYASCGRWSADAPGEA